MLYAKYRMEHNHAHEKCFAIAWKVVINHIIFSESKHDPILLSKYNAGHGGGEVVAPLVLPKNQIKFQRKNITCQRFMHKINM